MATATDQPARFRGIDYVKINILVLAIAGLWQSMHILILPQRLLDFVSEAQKNTYLGWLSFTGLLLAMMVQPIAGAISDKFGFKWGKRRPYIMAGCLGALLLLPGIGLAETYIALFIVYSLLQISANTALGPFQAFIPDMVPPARRGLASGVKGILEILGVIIVLIPVGLFIDRYASGGSNFWLLPSLGLIAFLLLATMLATLISVKEAPAVRSGEVSPGKTAMQTFNFKIGQNRGFFWLLVSRFFTYMSFATVQQFAFYYLSDVKAVTSVGISTALLVVSAGLGILLLSPIAGFISDRTGRKPIVFLAGITGAIGIVAMHFSHTLGFIALSAAIIGAAMGLHYSSNWALAADLVPPDEAARYLGLTNLATAGGAAVARLIGPVIDFFNSYQPGSGYDVMLAACFVYFILGSLLVLKVKGPYQPNRGTKIS